MSQPPEHDPTPSPFEGEDADRDTIGAERTGDPEGEVPRRREDATGEPSPRRTASDAAADSGDEAAGR
jgi:hypothetical protein